MLHRYRQLGTGFLVAMATFGLAVPTLLATSCACDHKSVAAKQALPPCCANRLDSQECQSLSTTTEGCCTDNAPCECPGCQCAFDAPDAIMPPAVVTIVHLDSHFLPLALPATSIVIGAEQISLLSHAQHQLAITSPVPLRALYCVWII